MRAKRLETVKLIIFYITLILSIGCYFYSQLIHIDIPIHSDDAGWIIDRYCAIEMGTASACMSLTPWRLFNRAVYCAFGGGELALQLFYTLGYCICILLSASLCLVENRKILWWLIPIFVFIALPGHFGTASIQPLKFHVWTMIIPLIGLVYCKNVLEKKGIIQLKEYIIVSLISAFGIIEMDVLIVVTCWVPFMLFAFYRVWRRGYLRKYINLCIYVLSLAVLAGAIILGNLAYNGYGAQKFVEIASVPHNFSLWCSGVLSLFNVNIEGQSVLQFSSFVNLIRLVIVLFGFGLVLKIFFASMSKHDENDIDVILAYSAVSIFFSFMFMGLREDLISIRYATYVYYILIILITRECGRIIKRYDVSRIAVSILFLICILVFAEPLPLNRDTTNLDELAAFLSNDSDTEMGLGDFWKAGVISVLSNYDTCIQAVEINDTGCEPFLNEWEYYDNGNNVFNFFVKDLDEKYGSGVSKSRLTKIFGNSVEEVTYADSIIYKYDYDIRTTPLVINDKNATMYLQDNLDLCVKPKSSIKTNNIYLTTGVVRMTLVGDGVSQLLIDSDNVDGIVLVKKSNAEVEYEISADSLVPNLNIVFSNNENKAIEISEIRFERLRNSMDLHQNDTVRLRCGTYYFAMEGDNIRNSSITVSGENNLINVTKMNNGDKKVLYEVVIKKEQNVFVEAESSGQIDCLYYQNKVLPTFNNPDCSIYNIDNGIKWDKNNNVYYGPYANINKGKYCINLYGENLDDFDISFTSELHEFDDIVLVNNDNDYYKYSFSTEKDLREFEVKIQKRGDANLSYYTIEKVDDNQRIDKVDLTFEASNRSVQCTTEVLDDEYILDNNDICYGPYICLPKGDYEVVIYGENLDSASIDLSINNGSEKLEYTEQKDKNRCVIRFSAYQMISDFEVVIKNIRANKRIVIKRYTIKSQ